MFNKSIDWMSVHYPSPVLLSFMAVVLCLLLAVLLTQHITQDQIFPMLQIAPSPVPVPSWHIVTG